LTEAIDDGVVTITDADGTAVSSDEIWADIFTRMAFPMEKMRDSETGLVYHGYCVEEGITNGIFWSRAMGWYAMALMEAAAKCPDTEKREILTEYFEQLMEAVVAWQDAETFLWYNVTNAKEEVTLLKDGEIIENKPESSGSAMLSYCLLRGYHDGLLKEVSFRDAGLCAFNALVETKLTGEGLTDICLKSAVYTSQSMYQVFGYAINDGKGSGPFIMATNYAY
jgi:unsaturated rhamnogalacturonyl hydrolase